MPSFPPQPIINWTRKSTSSPAKNDWVPDHPAKKTETRPQISSIHEIPLSEIQNLYQLTVIRYHAVPLDRNDYSVRHPSQDVLVGPKNESFS